MRSNTNNEPIRLWYGQTYPKPEPTQQAMQNTSETHLATCIITWHSLITAQ